MSLVEHLEDLRKSCIRIVFIVIVSFVICYHFGDQISEFLLFPLRTTLISLNGAEVVYLGILDKVLSKFQIAFWSSLIVSSPFWFYQLWKFIKPGLYDYEVKAVRPFIFISFIFFALGVCFGYFIVFPFTFETLVNFGVSDVRATISLKEYLVQALKVLVFLGVVFQLPNVLLILGFMGLVTKQSLAKVRSYVYVGFAVLSATLTPPDIFTMLGLWLPLVVLYEIGILAVAFFVHPYLARQHS